MNRKRILNIFLSLSIVLQAAFFQVALPNLVLCIGQEGHIAFEWHQEDSQCNHSKSSNKPSLGFIRLNVHQESEQGCTDIKLHFHPSQANKNQKQNLSYQATQYVNALHSRLIEKAINSLALRSPSINTINPVPGSEQNTILLI